jgi:hypothetical protein
MPVRRSTVVTLALAGALGGGAVAVGAPGVLAGSNQAPTIVHTHPSVRPRVGHRHSKFELKFTLAQAPGRAGLVDTYYSELISPPAHAAPACSPSQPAPVSTGSQGATIKIHLHRPTRGWCKGRYELTVFLDRTQLCGPPIALPAISCPVSLAARPPSPIRRVDTGQTHFTVR